MFGKPFNIDLLSSQTDDYVITWKEFNDRCLVSLITTNCRFTNKITHFSIILIGVSSGCTLEVLNRLLESVYDCIVLIVGDDEVKSLRNVERFKRELRVTNT